jgi:site-specific DNA recombinase
VTKAAIYARVSTLVQEEDGTSLNTQIEAGLTRARMLDHEVPAGFIFSEVWSGLQLERPVLDELRSKIRSGEIDAVIVHSTDRLSRDPIHLYLLAQEFEKKGVRLEIVLEPLDNSAEGQLLTFVRGWAGKLEAQKIRERTMRGKRARAKGGKLPTGSCGLYGYYYDKATGKRVPNDALKVVRMMGEWVLEGLSKDAIIRRLNDLTIPSPKGFRWGRSTVARILTNPVYAGETVAFKWRCVEPPEKREVTEKSNGIPKQKRYTKTRREINDPSLMVSLPQDTTPPIFTKDEWQAIQDRLARNASLAPRHVKHSYLLRGFIRCRWCSHAYYGVPMHGLPCYRCGRRGPAALGEPNCRNKMWSSGILEPLVWGQIERVILNPDVVTASLIERSQEDQSEEWLLEQLQIIENRLHRLKEGRERRLIRLYTLGEIDDEWWAREKAAIRQERDALIVEQAALQAKIEARRKLSANLQRVEEVCEALCAGLKEVSSDEKRQIMVALDITVWIDKDNVTIEGALPLATDANISVLRY